MATQRQAARREDILHLLRATGSAEGITARQVSEALGIHYTTANDDLHILRNEGKVKAQGGPAFGMPRSWRSVG